MLLIKMNLSKGILLASLLIVSSLAIAQEPPRLGNRDLPPPPPPITSKDQPSAEEPAADSNSGHSEINIKNADLVAVIRIFGKKTKRNYILDERVKGKVSIYLPGTIPDTDAVRILDSTSGGS